MMENVVETRFKEVPNSPVMHCISIIQTHSKLLRLKITIPLTEGNLVTIVKVNSLGDTRHKRRHKVILHL